MAMKAMEMRANNYKLPRRLRNQARDKIREAKGIKSKKPKHDPSITKGMEAKLQFRKDKKDHQDWVLGHVRRDDLRKIKQRQRAKLHSWAGTRELPGRFSKGVLQIDPIQGDKKDDDKRAKKRAKAGIRYSGLSK
eukprot:CAMPEP_0197535144 /NCGR_PEP_ID=MMETSP1318-20131121/49565_1 /TAXON_ID=552666 /ORGANISM="Partenskyella glossopodia, Strain RCC365" /LENGTH=134 /DNA_ID=CAMNT_0043092645 /DNA_START=60 /DNA_END=464 /DNA_ORIENTATION=+